MDRASDSLVSKRGVPRRVSRSQSRCDSETPAGTILYEAHAAVESICLEHETLHFNQQVALRYAELVYYGQWYTPLREALDAYFDQTQKRVSGTVRLKLYKGHCRVVGTKSPNSLYMPDLASFTMGEEYDSTDATGFIRLYGLLLNRLQRSV